MAGTTPRTIAGNRKEIAASLFRLGATSYGGPAIMGVMQAELQERRQWLSKPRFVGGLALVNMLPGATAAQLPLFLGYTRRGRGGAVPGGPPVVPAPLCPMRVPSPAC